METVVLVIHLIIALAIIALVLLQRSEGGGLGMGGGGAGNFASARGTASALTRATAVCALIFFITSLTLGVLASRDRVSQGGLLEDIAVEDVQVQAPVEGGVKVEYVPAAAVEAEAEAEAVTQEDAPVAIPEIQVEQEVPTPDTPSSVTE